MSLWCTDEKLLNREGHWNQHFDQRTYICQALMKTSLLVETLAPVTFPVQEFLIASSLHLRMNLCIAYSAVKHIYRSGTSVFGDMCHLTNWLFMIEQTGRCLNNGLLKNDNSLNVTTGSPLGEHCIMSLSLLNHIAGT